MQRTSNPAWPPHVGIAEVVDGAIIALADLRGRRAAAEIGALDGRLRSALDVHVGRSGEQTGVVAALRVACAHLAAGDVDAASAALTVARERASPLRG
jgi:hypothetical protein